jgi:hypothetical protein
MIDRAPGNHPDEVVSQLAPIGHKHINMRGIVQPRSAGFLSWPLASPLRARSMIRRKIRPPEAQKS